MMTISYTLQRDLFANTLTKSNLPTDIVSVPLKKVTLEVEPRQFDGNLGETVNNLTKDYIKGATNPTPEEVLTQLSLYRLTPIFRHCAASSTNLQAISS